MRPFPSVALPDQGWSLPQLSLVGLTRRNRLQRFDVRRPGQVLTNRGEHLGHRGRAAVRLERFFIGPLLDENEGLAGLVQRVQRAAGFAVHFVYRAGEDVAGSVDRFGLDGQGGDDDNGHARASWWLRG